MKILLASLGTLALTLGILGIFLPLLPTTPFLLLAATLYVRSSARLYEWLMNQPHLGPYIRQFREQKAIPMRAKIISVTMVWATLLYCIFFVVSQWWIRGVLFCLAVGISWHILSYKTLKQGA